MEQNYTVNTLEVKTIASGKRVANCELKDEQGNLVSGTVSIWEDFPSFSNMTFGSVVRGTIKANDKGYKSLYAPRAPKSGGGASFGATAMKAKQEGIERSQDRKEEAILASGSMRDAVLIVTTFYRSPRFNFSDTEIQDKIRAWRKWLISEHDLPTEPF